MTTKPEVALKTPVGRTSAGLRDALFDELDSLRNGMTNAANANATAKLAAAIVDTVTMEMEVHRILAKNPPSSSSATVLPPLQLTGRG